MQLNLWEIFEILFLTLKLPCTCKAIFWLDDLSQISPFLAIIHRNLPVIFRGQKWDFNKISHEFNCIFLLINILAYVYLVQLVSVFRIPSPRDDIADDTITYGGH